ncbi:MAG: MerR family DNA-binding transcriptional regulator [Candidatus Poribacteria bacterium]|jgi:DNA-binding transcriptional MerR regulator|nr:MerR family DNA-binding transcriptional regulator [Candidatus Poribacteria bacterium]
MNGRHYPADIARLAGCHPKTVRKLADLGLIPSQRDYNGWRVFCDAEASARIVRRLLTGQDKLACPDQK